MFEAFSTWLEGTGDFVYLAAPLFTVLVAILPIPAEIPALLNGMVFGPLWGTLITWAAAIAGAQISFELSRRWGRPFGARMLPPTALERADALVANAGWPALLALRLMPAVAFTAVNWAAGLTMMRRWTFFWTTAVGIFPGAVAFTTSGSGLIALARGAGVIELLWVLVTGLLLLAAVLAWRRTRPGSSRPVAGEPVEPSV